MSLIVDAVRGSDPLRGGFAWLEDNGAGCFHPGVDLNGPGGPDADCGEPIRAFGAMRLVAHLVDATGFGMHQWWRLDGGAFDGAHVHLCHLSSVAHEEAGHEARPGEVIASIGKSGGWSACHLHLEVCRTRPPDWRYWPKGLGREEVAGMYHDPLAVLEWYEGAAHEAGAREATGLGVTPSEERAILHALDQYEYPAQLVPDLIRVSSGLQASAHSLTEWVERIGALEAVVAERDAEIARLRAALEGRA